MVGHETEGIDLTIEGLFKFSEIIEVIEAIILSSKDGLSVVAALNDMVRIIGQNNSCCAWHGSPSHVDTLKLAMSELAYKKKIIKLNNNKSVPFLPIGIRDVLTVD